MLKYKIPQVFTLTLFSYIDLLNYMLKYKIPQIVTLTRRGDGKFLCKKQKSSTKYICRGSL